MSGKLGIMVKQRFSSSRVPPWGYGVILGEGPQRRIAYWGRGHSITSKLNRHSYIMSTDTDFICSEWGHIFSFNAGGFATNH